MKLNKDLFIQNEPVKQHLSTEEEQYKIDFVAQRFNDMEAVRNEVERNWQIYQTMVEALYTPYPDERSSSVVPLLSSLVELYVAEAVKLKTTYNFKWETGAFKEQAQALEYVWKYVRRKNKIDRELLWNEYVAAIFGISVLYTGFESITRKQNDFTITDDLQYKFEEKEITTNKIFVKNFDIRNFWFDDNVKDDFDEAVDCIAEEYMSYEKFKHLKNNKLYKNIDKVKARTYDKNYQTFITSEEEAQQGQVVRIRHYWNVERDIYVVIANENMIIREHPIISTMNGKKCLPFVVRSFGKKLYSLYGRGFWEAAMMFDQEINNLREMLMDAIRRSNHQVLAIWNGLTFDWRTFSYENEILTFDWQLQGNFEQISGNPPNSAIFDYLTRIYKDIAMYIWIDVQNILGEPQQTAFQTEVQREASQKRVNVWLMNRDFAYERLADQFKDLLQIYFPLKTVEWIYPEIEIKWAKFDDKSKKFKKRKWSSVFKVTPESIRGDIQVDVFTNTTAPTINVVDREQKLQLINSLAGMAQWYGLAKQSWVDINKILPAEETMRDLAKDFNLNPVERSWDDTKEQANELRDQLKGMLPITREAPAEGEELEPNA